ncbi:Nuclease-related domain-containing protein [Virgibacillus salinus]|uniref:Nuclease-related domain-containing protein n=2 Tax=Virgibacillus salinus TaxID=553311 RepID=A0A1H1DKU8_9BACI|nr:Nuclease-related domain-containing protein [Virgibacillus salinus]
MVSPSKSPALMLQTEALSWRLAERHFKSKEVNKHAKNLRAGYNGEKSLEFTLGFLPEYPYIILHNLRIHDENGFFQIDTLILSPQFILIVEVKNIAGTVVYDEFGQAIRITKKGEEENLGNHIEQINLQHFRLLRWVREHDFPVTPIEKLIAYSNPTTIIKNITNNTAISETVIHKESLLTKIDGYASTHKNVSLSEQQLHFLSSFLITAHTTNKVDILKKYQVVNADILRGVFCPVCGSRPMNRKKAIWICHHCGATSKNAHFEALRHYSLLIGNTINNRQARDFLQVDGIQIAHRLLVKEQFKQIGNTSGRRYILTF